MPRAAQLPMPASPAGAGASTYTGTRGGAVYKLGQVIGEGGNGVVYTVARQPELVAKLQKSPLSPNETDKLDLLARAVTPDLLAVAAWPMDCLRAPSGDIAGFVMPRILDARPLYELYSPRSRIQHFPAADYRFLVHVAANIARLFAAVHQAGFICGDVNHSNVLVRPTGTVAAVDCDSFQIGDGSRFPCQVGTPLFVPPELMGLSLGTTRRTVNHDGFGLAVLIFHLLFMGRHPFAGRFLGPGDMPIEQAIKEGRYAYSRHTSRTRTAPPPFVPPMDNVGNAVADLFERAFDPKSAQAGRPTPADWIAALETLKASLVACKSVPWHFHVPGTDACPWCAIEAPTRVKLFGGLVRAAGAAIADLESLWARYQMLIAPPAVRPLPKPPSVWQRLGRGLKSVSMPNVRIVATELQQRVASWAGRLNLSALLAVLGIAGLLYLDPQYATFREWIRSLSRQAGWTIEDAWTIFLAYDGTSRVLFTIGLLLVAAVPLALLRWIGKVLLRLFVLPPSQPQTPSRMTRPTANKPPTGGPRRRDAKRAWAAAIAAWKAQPAYPDNADLRTPIEAAKQQLDRLGSEREAAIKACTVPETPDAQRANYLGSFRIEAAKLANIGPARCAVLRSWGIDTAADIDAAKILEIPGFGAGLTDKLVSWREQLDQAFVARDTVTVDPLEVLRIDRQLAARRAKLMRELREKIADLDARMRGYQKQRDQLWADVEAAYRQLAA